MKWFRIIIKEIFDDSESKTYTQNDLGEIYLIPVF